MSLVGDYWLEILIGIILLGIIFTIWKMNKKQKLKLSSDDAEVADVKNEISGMSRQEIILATRKKIRQVHKQQTELFKDLDSFMAKL